MAARWSSKPEVAGSIPAAHFFAGVAQRMSRRLVSGRMWVRFPPPALLGDRLIGRMADSDSVGRGSNPCLPVILERSSAAVALVPLTSRRGFDPHRSYFAFAQCLFA